MGEGVGLNIESGLIAGRETQLPSSRGLSRPINSRTPAQQYGLRTEKGDLREGLGSGTVQAEEVTLPGP